MQILAVTLTNFKTHRDQSFQFLAGTNAICGENGAGKTSILEAIAWTLFNYRGSYKTEDLIRNGAASAQVRVSFISSADSRTYEVQRCTQKGYQVYDPQLQARLDLSRIEEDVLPWLRQHLGVPPQTDLARLFANTVGVPQGTFTADFLKAPNDRKKTFDATLKVEAYRQAYEGLATVEKYAKVEVEKLDQAIAQYEEALVDWQPLQTKHQELHQTIAQLLTERQQGQAQLQALEQECQQLRDQAAQIQAFKAQWQTLNAQLQAQTQLSNRLEQELQQTVQAVAVCEGQVGGYKAFLASEAALRVLETQQQQQGQLLDQRQVCRDQLAQQQAQVQALRQQEQRLQSLAEELEQLAPLIQQQAQLEQQQQALLQQLQEVQQAHQALEREQSRLVHLQGRLTALEAEIEAIQLQQAAVMEIPALEAQQQRCQQQLSRVEAARQFEAELQQLLQQSQAQTQQQQQQVEQARTLLEELQAALPLYTESLHHILTTLIAGTDLNGQMVAALTTILADLSTQTAPQALAQQLQQLEEQLRTARQQQIQVLRLEGLVAEQTQLQQEIQGAEAHLQQVQAVLTQAPGVQALQAQLAAELADLQDPRSRHRFYQQELQQYPQLQQQSQAAVVQVEQTQQALNTLEAQLAPLADLAAQVQQHQGQRDQSRSAYQTYLEHQHLASRFAVCQAERQQALDQQSALTAEVKAVEQSLEQARVAYSAEHHQQLEVAYRQAETALVALTARLPEIENRLQDVEAQLEHLQHLRLKCDRAHQERRERHQVQQFITFSRKAYKQAGPRITERYVQRISREADRLFRELLNRPNVSLEWTRDYDIVVQEGTHPRRFINLSGGEQMCAALAVRLALLKVLAALDIAFFDEPTTNMDRARREQLAEAIANIKTFRQLFVISHDDTFEKVTGNVVLVERLEA